MRSISNREAPLGGEDRRGAATGTEKWQAETNLAGLLSGEIQSSPAVAGGGWRRGVLRQLRRSRAPKNTMPPAVADGMVYAATHGAAVFALDAATGKQLGQIESEGSVQSAPVLDSGVLYVDSNDSALYAFAERSKKTRKAITVEARLLDEYAGDYRVGAVHGVIRSEGDS
jgi:outer membrane protein assembly factor BamB